MADIAADLTTLHQEVEPGHPLLGADTSFSGKVVNVRDQAFHQIRQTTVTTLRVDFDRIRRDIVDG